MKKLVKINDDQYIRADAIEEVIVRRYDFAPIEKTSWEVVYALTGESDYSYLESFKTQDEAREFAANFVSNINAELAL